MYFGSTFRTFCLAKFVELKQYCEKHEADWSRRKSAFCATMCQIKNITLQYPLHVCSNIKDLIFKGVTTQRNNVKITIIVLVAKLV